jgi:hypothetical protein
VWLTSSPVISDRTRQFARRSAIAALVLGMAGQVATTCWPRPEWIARRGRSPPWWPACRFWSWAWGPRWLTCSAATQLGTPLVTQPGRSLRCRRASTPPAMPQKVRNGQSPAPPGTTAPGHPHASGSPTFRRQRRQ